MWSRRCDCWFSSSMSPYLSSRLCRDPRCSPGGPFFLLPSSFLYVKTFLLIICTYHFNSFSVIFLDVCVYSGCSSNIVVSYLIFLCCFTHPLQHIHLICLCPCFCPFVVAQISAQYSIASLTYWLLVFLHLPIQLHWYLPVSQHSTTFRPISPHCTHSLFDLFCFP